MLPMPLARTLIDLATPARAASELLAACAADPTTRAIAVARSGQIVQCVSGGVMAALADAVPLAYLGRYQGANVVLIDALELGRSGDVGGRCAVSLGDPFVGTGSATELCDLRVIGAQLVAAEASFATVAVALRQWQTQSNCVKCGETCTLRQAGWVMHCPSCGVDRYPRTDPCIIVAVTDAADRLLLARAAHYPRRRASVLAGYVEPGESLEAAVVREVFEEAGVQVDGVHYRGSQPWPFPCSLMCAFTARVSGMPDPVIDGSEIVAAQFLTRTEVRQRCADGSLQLPSGVSVASALIDDWLTG